MNAFRRPLFVASLLLLAAHARAQLAANSPFMPPPGAVTTAPTENTPIELRGIMALGSTIRFCIYDTVKKTSAWVGLDEKGYDFMVKTQDLARDSVTVEQSGRTLTLQLRETKVVSAGQAVAPMPNPVTQATTPLNPTPADEQQRLDAVTSEVRRRRALREQASQQAASGVQPPPTVVQPVAPVVAPQPQMQQQSGGQQNTNRQRRRQ